MATTQDQLQPTATTPVATTPPPVSQPIQSTPAVPLTVSPSVNDVYTPTNIQQIDVPGTKSAMNMKLSKLEDKLAKAKSIEELNQIEIMNQPKAMGVLTGEASMRSRLDSARLNAFNSLYQNRLLEEQRKEQERQDFINTYGADPNKRSKGMSKKQFIDALGRGEFNNLLTMDFKLKQADLASKNKSLSGSGSGAINSNNFYIEANNLKQQGKSWGEIADTLGKKYDLTPGSDYSRQLDAIMTGQPMSASITPELVSSWAERIANGQSKITDIPASQAELRNQVQIKLSQLGNDAEGKPTTTEMGKQALSTANDLLSKFDKGEGTSAVGKSRWFTFGQTIPGTSARDFETTFQSLKDKLSLDAVKYLKGQGQVSDAERALLASAVTKLNLNQSEGEFRKTLQQIISQLSGNQSNNDNNDPLGLGI